MARVDQLPAEKTADTLINVSLSHLPEKCLTGCLAVAACRRGLVEGYALQDSGQERASVRQLDSATTSLDAIKRVTTQSQCTEPTLDGQCTNPIINAAQNAR